MKERFSIPGVGGIIVKSTNGEEYILIQDRVKKGSGLFQFTKYPGLLSDYGSNLHLQNQRI